MRARKIINLADDLSGLNIGNVITLSGTVLIINDSSLSHDLQEVDNSVIYLDIINDSREKAADRASFLITLIEKHGIRGIIGKTINLDDEILECLRRFQAVYFFAINYSYSDQVLISQPNSKNTVTLVNLPAAVILDAKGRYLHDTT